MKLQLAFIFLVVANIQLYGFSNLNSEKPTKNEATFGIDAALSNKYVWRGISYNNGLVFQPNVFIGFSDFRFNLWSNFTVWDMNNELCNELDVSIIHAFEFSNFNVESSLNYFHYFEDMAGNTFETVLNTSYRLNNFSLFNILSLDVMNHFGRIYNELGFKYAMKVNSKIELNGKAILGYASHKHNLVNHNINDGSFNYLGVGASIKYVLSPNYSLQLYYQHNTLLNQQLKQSQKSNSSYFELLLSRRF